MGAKGGVMTYKEYLLSDWWQYFRQLVLFNRCYTCEHCGVTASYFRIKHNGEWVTLPYYGLVPEMHVHHKHYLTVGNECLDDVKLLCGDCHKKVHGIGGVG